MSSILKILVDIQCVVYCDFEEVGEANPYSLFKMELRKGSYIIDFKKDDINLKSIKYDKKCRMRKTVEPSPKMSQTGLERQKSGKWAFFTSLSFA